MFWLGFAVGFAVGRLGASVWEAWTGELQRTPMDQRPEPAFDYRDPQTWERIYYPPGTSVTYTTPH